MQEHEILITRLFNDHLAGFGNWFLGLAGMQAEPRPWANFVTMQLVVAAIFLVVFAALRPRLSVERPGKFQHIFELIHDFIKGQTDEQVGHRGRKYIPFFGTIFLFVLFCNLIGIVPGFESPTMFHYVPAGIALAAFLYYNFVGIQSQGVGKYFAHFAGPDMGMGVVPRILMGLLMVPIEIVSNLARPLSLTIRLFANMYAGEQVTLVFLSLTYLFIPAAFMGLHVFVSFLQAYIFALLTMVYVAGATAHDH
jgi:F-type H+-transporting ATPase subunit a